ncbi:hypothetical protein PM10SUCC1_01760 [Propionigenium maris DSM 9537]|uniref:Uncharacterized protein n=1 Tax=Propionigenium maris DSM 9537 TaxID=1123000 RepID=A0A9W6LKV6_9FUSO|nr:hypothetical protein [Propionigenium maris]GLI54661.1 hypothetical protein PM10SUCC1_01760 [Propionigenium maris DSM 9537]
MLKKIQDYLKNIAEYNIEERYYYKRVRPEFLTHDEICYHIESVVALDIHYGSRVKEFIFYEENLRETIGEELEVDLDDFIDFDTMDPAYKKAVVQMKDTINQLK